MNESDGLIHLDKIVQRHICIENQWENKTTIRFHRELEFARPESAEYSGMNLKQNSHQTWRDQSNNQGESESSGNVIDSTVLNCNQKTKQQFEFLENLRLQRPECAGCFETKKFPKKATIKWRTNQFHESIVYCWLRSFAVTGKGIAGIRLNAQQTKEPQTNTTVSEACIVNECDSFIHLDKTIYRNKDNNILWRMWTHKDPNVLSILR